jgi:hypothetical protein
MIGSREGNKGGEGGRRGERGAARRGGKEGGVVLPKREDFSEGFSEERAARKGGRGALLPQPGRLAGGPAMMEISFQPS